MAYGGWAGALTGEEEEPKTEGNLEAGSKDFDLGQRV